MTTRRQFVAGSAVGLAAAAMPVALHAREAASFTAESFRDLKQKGFLCQTDEGYEVRLTLVDVWDSAYPGEDRIEQFALLLGEKGASGAAPLAEGIYRVTNKKFGTLDLFLSPSDTYDGHYVAYFNQLK